MSAVPRPYSPTAFLLPLALMSTFLLAGCATLLSGSSDEIGFTSEPPGAEVVIDDVVVGETPTTVEVDRPGLEDQQVTVRIDGFEPRTFELQKQFNGTAVLNIFFWPGFIIDALAGPLFQYDKTAYSVEMESGRITLDLNDLERDSDGTYLLPETEGSVRVHDRETGVMFLFGDS